MEIKESENKTDWTDRTTEEIEQERQAETQEKDAAELGTLTDKVLYLMEKISEYGFLTMQEIHLVYRNKTYAYDVMKRLRGQGWIADFDTAMRPATGHYLTPRGYLALVKFGKLRVGGRFRLERYTPFIFRHRLACARVGLALEKHPLVREFLPESLLWRRRKNEADKLCDGEFLYGVPGREELERVGLEVELTLKNKDRLAESFDQLGRRGLDQVWWICGDETILKALRHQVIERPLRFDQRHLFCLLGEFLAVKEHRACLIDAGGQEFTIDPAAPTLSPRRPEPPAAPIVAPPPQLAVEAPHHEPTVVKTMRIARPPRIRSTPPEVYREPSWIRRSAEVIWHSFLCDFLSDFERQERYYDAHERDGRLQRRNAKTLLMVVAGCCIGLAVSVSIVGLEKLTASMRDWTARFSASAPASVQKWRSLRSDAASGERGDFRFSVKSFEVKGERRRMRLKLERVGRSMYGCSLQYIAVNDPRGREVRRWTSGLRIGDSDSWDSEPLEFRASSSVRRFTIILDLIGIASECRRWELPIVLK